MQSVDYNTVPTWLNSSLFWSLRCIWTVCTKSPPHCRTVKPQAGKGPAFSHWTTEQDLDRGARNTTAMIAAASSTDTSKTEWTLYAWHQCMWKAIGMGLIAWAAQRTSTSHWILVTFIKWGRTSIRHDAYGVSHCRMGGTTIETEIRRITFYHWKGPWCAPIDTKMTDATWKVQDGAYDYQSNIDVAHQSGIRSQVADKLSRLPTTGID